MSKEEKETASDTTEIGKDAEAATEPDTTPDRHGDEVRSIKKATFNGLVIGLIVAIGAASFLAGMYASSMMDKPQVQEQITSDDLDKAVAKLELLIMQQRLSAAANEEQEQIVRISADDDPVIGDPNAPITIIEFSDFQCPFCERFSIQTLPVLEREYIDKGLVKLVFRDFPIQNIHPNAAITALAAECADDQGEFKMMHDVLFEKRTEWAGANSQEIVNMLIGYATDIGIDSEEFTDCVVTGRHVEEIGRDLADGRLYGVSGTPGFYIGNDQIGYVQIQGAQPFESFKRVLDAQLGL